MDTRTIFGCSAFALSLCLSHALAAAPLPSPWLEADPLTPLASISGEPVFRLGQRAITSAQQVFAFAPHFDQCNEIHALPIPGRASDFVPQVISPVDLGRPCEANNRFGSSFALLGDQLVVSAPRESARAESSPQLFDGEIYLFAPGRDPDAPNNQQRWQLAEILRGDRFGLSFLGIQLQTSGERIFTTIVQPFTPIPPTPSDVSILRQVGIAVLARDGRGEWQRQSNIQLPPGEPLQMSHYLLAGDQVLLSAFNTQSNEFEILVYEESATGAGDWALTQQLDNVNNLSAPENLRSFIIPTQASGDYLLMQSYTSLNADGSGNAGFPIYRRDAQGHWQYHHQVDLNSTEARLDPITDEITSTNPGNGFISLTFPTATLNGADLIASWFQGIFFYRPVHYRLNETGVFEPVQALNTVSSADLNAEFYLADQALVVFEGSDQLNVYQRESGSNFAINRGLSGGWWFGPQRNGQGVGLEILPNNRVQMVWLTHDLSGQQQWLFGAGDIDVDRVRIDLLQPVGGEFGPDFDSNNVQRLPWGQVELVFSSCEQGELRYQSNTQGSGTLPLLRLSKVDGLDCGEATASPLARRWTGSWFDPSHNGEGLMMHVTPSRNGPRLSALWMSYQPDGRQAAFYTATDINSTQSAQFNSVIRPTGLNFDGSGVLQRNPWGRFDLNSSQCDRSLLNYQSDLPEFGDGQLNLLRFTRPLGTGCF